MTTAPTVPASPSRILVHAPVGELSTALCVFVGFGRDGAVGAAFAVNYGPKGGAPSEWTSRQFPFTAEGEALARAKFAALVDAAGRVQS